jgi:6-phosphofructokinase 2
VRCFYLSGGATGPALDGLLEGHGLPATRIPIAGPTRVATAVFERETGKEYRFTPAGPTVSHGEWQACLDALAQAQCSHLIASGSLPPGAPEDFYARAAAAAAKTGAKFVLDSSGPGLRGGLAGGGVYLVKPSCGELRQLAGDELKDDAAIARAAMAIVEAGQAEMVAVTIGHLGALLARREGVVRLPAVAVEAKSAVGAGDSFLAGMVFALAQGEDPVEAFRFGIAAGTAAVLTPGTNLAYPDDIRRLLPQVERP